MCSPHWSFALVWFCFPICDANRYTSPLLFLFFYSFYVGVLQRTPSASWHCHLCIWTLTVEQNWRSPGPPKSTADSCCVTLQTLRACSFYSVKSHASLSRVNSRQVKLKLLMITKKLKCYNVAACLASPDNVSNSNAGELIRTNSKCTGNYSCRHQIKLGKVLRCWWCRAFLGLVGMKQLRTESICVNELFLAECWPAVHTADANRASTDQQHATGCLILNVNRLCGSF